MSTGLVILITMVYILIYIIYSVASVVRICDDVHLGYAILVKMS
jgi:hypothetical protein